jgi:hypothetical protein
LAVAIEQLLVGFCEQRLQGGGLMVLSRRQVEVQGMARTIAEQMDFRRKPTAGAA